jgi:hypothetical protein
MKILLTFIGPHHGLVLRQLDDGSYWSHRFDPKDEQPGYQAPDDEQLLTHGLEHPGNQLNAYHKFCERFTRLRSGTESN